MMVIGALLRVDGRSMRIQCDVLCLRLMISLRRRAKASTLFQDTELGKNKTVSGAEDDPPLPTSGVHIDPAPPVGWMSH